MNDQVKYIENIQKNIYSLDNIEIEELFISVRAYNCLKRAGINTLRDLVSKPMYEIRKIRNLGNKTLEGIADTIKLMDLHLDMSEEEIEKYEKDYNKLQEAKAISIINGEMTIDEFGLSPYCDTYDCLKRVGIHRVIELIRLTEDEIRNIEQIGIENILELDSKLSPLEIFGIHFGLTREEEEYLKYKYMNEEEKTQYFEKTVMQEEKTTQLKEPNEQNNKFKSRKLSR